MAIESNLAGVVRVAYEAVTGEFNRDVDVAARNYAQGNEQMSDSAIKLELAQDRLRRAVAKGPAASREQARALLQVRQAEREVRAETDRTTTATNRGTAAQDRYGRELESSARRTSRFTGVLRGLRSGLAIATGGMLGATGLVIGFNRAKDAASDLAEQTDKTRLVFGKAAPEVERFAGRALGLSRDQALELASTFGALLRPIGLVGKASADLSTDLVKRGVDLSSFYNTDVASALDAVRSGVVGESEPLRRYGAALSEARVQALALAQSGKENASQLTQEEKVRARIAIILDDTSIAADNYRKTIGGAANQEREAASNARDLEASIGRGLLPAYRDVLRQVNAYLGSQENQERIQRKVTAAVDAGIKVVHGLADGFNLVRRATEPLVDALGGIEKAAQLAFIVGVVARVRRAALSFGLLQASSSRTAAKGVADATVFGRAWDVATRPRNMIVTTTVTGGGTVVTPGGRGTGRTTTTPRPTPRRVPTPIIPLPGVGAVITGALIVDALTGGHGTNFVAQGLRGGKDIDVEALKRAARNGRITFEHLPQLRNIIGYVGFDEGDYNAIAGIVARRNARGAATGPEEGAAGQSIAAETRRRARARRTGGNRPTSDGLTAMQRAELAASEAELTPGLQDDLREARRIEAIYRKRAEAEGLKGKALFEARQELNAARGRTQAIEDQIAADQEAAEDKADQRRKDAAAKAERRRKERAAKRKAAAEALYKRKVEEAQQEAALNAPPDLKHIADIAGKRAEAMARFYGRDPEEIRRRDDARRKAKGDTDAMTRDELGGILRDFLTSFTSMVGTYYSNISAPSLQTHVLESLTREQTSVIRGAVTRPRPSARLEDESLWA